jgi:ABC-2 type transport system ATP-binding protein
VRPHRDHQPRALITNKPTRELVGMAREKVVVLTLDKPLASAAAPGLLKAVLNDRQVEITYNKDRSNAGEVLGWSRPWA